MGFDLHSAFERREEWKAARLEEVEFAEMARALKALAGEQGLNSQPVIASLAGQGLSAALGLLAEMAGSDVEPGYYRCRAQAHRD
ncbi:MAG: hypothetical protein RLZZ427_883 [Pseudomonadota bacterium]|jgi:hypothetical protein